MYATRHVDRATVGLSPCVCVRWRLLSIWPAITMIGLALKICVLASSETTCVVSVSGFIALHLGELVFGLPLLLRCLHGYLCSYIGL